MILKELNVGLYKPIAGGHRGSQSPVDMGYGSYTME